MTIICTLGILMTRRQPSKPCEYVVSVDRPATDDMAGGTSGAGVLQTVHVGLRQHSPYTILGLCALLFNFPLRS